MQIDPRKPETPQLYLAIREHDSRPFPEEPMFIGQEEYEEWQRNIENLKRLQSLSQERFSSMIRDLNKRHWDASSSNHPA
jgi:hypothetical protein